MNQSSRSLFDVLSAEDIVVTTEAGTCPPVPASTKVAAESRNNYATGADNPQGIYGFTGLMAVNTWDTSCYGEVRPGYVWLMAGTYDWNPPAYNGDLYLNCTAQAPLTGAGGTLHGEMCSILGRPTTDFIGFATYYPYYTSGNVSYNSGTCNPYWFGSRTISTDCDGTNWQNIVYQTLVDWLPSS